MERTRTGVCAAAGSMMPNGAVRDGRGRQAVWTETEEVDDVYRDQRGVQRTMYTKTREIKGGRKVC